MERDFNLGASTLGFRGEEHPILEDTLKIIQSYQQEKSEIIANYHAAVRLLHEGAQKKLLALDESTKTALQELQQ